MNGVEDLARSAEGLPSAHWNSPMKEFGPTFSKSSNRTVQRVTQAGKRDGWRSGISSGGFVVLGPQAPKLIAVVGRFNIPERAHQFEEIVAIKLPVRLPLHCSWIWTGT